MEEVKEKFENFWEFARKKNLELNISKFVISEEVEFGSSMVSSETVKGEDVISITPQG